MHFLWCSVPNIIYIKLEQQQLRGNGGYCHNDRWHIKWKASGFVMLWGNFASLVFISSLIKMSPYKSIKLLWLITLIIWWNISMLMGVVSFSYHLQGMRAHWMAWCIWRSCLIALPETRSRLSGTPMRDFWLMFETAFFTTLIKATTETTSFRRMVPSPRIQVQRIVECNKDVLVN